MLQVRDLVVEAGGRPVVEGASFTLRAGDKVGLVGRNGAGKTSLLKAVAGEAPVAGGAVLRRGDVGFLPQDPGVRLEARTTTALSYILSARGLGAAAVRLEVLRSALEHTASSRNVARYSRSEEEFRDAGGYSAESEARRVCAGLGLAADGVDLPVGALSGGERRRVELARILFAGSDLLLLDEPTNHLDMDAKAWLMKFLASYRGGLIVVSHDLVLLDRSVTRVLHLDGRALIEYKGTYSQYRQARKQDEERLAKVVVRQQAEIKRLSALADSMRHQTERRARIAKSLDSRVERMKGEAVSAPSRERKVRVRFPDPPHSGRVALVVEDLAKGYGGPPVFEAVSFDIGRGERLMVIGLNGAGKTSLLRILAGETQPDAGTARFGTGVTVGYYAQEHEGLAAHRDVLSHMRAQAATHGSARPTDQQLRGLLGMFGVSGDMAFQLAGTLSGGEKTKLALAQLVAGRHNLLLLDEPTNNLDPPSREGVAAALAEWPGSMVIVSHDQLFVEALQPDRALFMPDGTLSFWSEDLLDLVSLA